MIKRPKITITSWKYLRWSASTESSFRNKSWFRKRLSRIFSINKVWLMSIIPQLSNKRRLSPNYNHRYKTWTHISALKGSCWLATCNQCKISSDNRILEYCSLAFKACRDRSRAKTLCKWCLHWLNLIISLSQRATVAGARSEFPMQLRATQNLDFLTSNFSKQTLTSSLQYICKIMQHLKVVQRLSVKSLSV